MAAGFRPDCRQSGQWAGFIPTRRHISADRWPDDARLVRRPPSFSRQSWATRGPVQVGDSQAGYEQFAAEHRDEWVQEVQAEPEKRFARAWSSSAVTSGIPSAIQIRGERPRGCLLRRDYQHISALEAGIKEWRRMPVGTYPLRRTPLFEAAAPVEAQRNPIDCNCEQACLARLLLGNRLYNSWNSSAPAVCLPSRVRVMPL